MDISIFVMIDSVFVVVHFVCGVTVAFITVRSDFTLRSKSSE